MSTTKNTLRTQFYNILREESDASAYPLVFADQLLNAAQNKICVGRVINPFTKEVANKGELSFLFTDKYYSNVQSTSLTANVVIGATTMTVGSTTGYPTSGVLYIAGNIVLYTGKTTTTFTGVTGILFPFQGGQEVSIAFDLPTDYASAINVIYNNTYKLPAQLYDDIYENLNGNKTGNYGLMNRQNAGYNMMNSFYTLKDDKYLIIFNRNGTGDMIKLRYEKQAPMMIAPTDISIIENDNYAQSTIPYLAVAEMLYNRGEERRASELYGFAIGQIKEMYYYYNARSKETQNGTQYKTVKNRLNV